MFKQVILVVPTAGGCREDGNVYYTEYLLIDNGRNHSLAFDEDIFTDEDFGPRACPTGEEDDDADNKERLEEIKTILIGLGYSVRNSETMFMELKVE